MEACDDEMKSGGSSSYAATPNFGQSTCSDTRSSITANEERPVTVLQFTPNSATRRSLTAGSPNFGTPSPTCNIHTPDSRIGKLTWHDECECQGLQICPEE